MRSHTQGTVYGVEYQIQCIGSDVDKTGISQSSYQVGLMNVHKEQKECCLQVCEDLLNRYKADSSSFLDHIIISGVTTTTWSQNDSPQSGDVNSPSKEKFMIQPSAGKGKHIVFCDGKEVILLDLMKPGQTTNSDTTLQH